jgi:3-oxoacyl-[acyl-carrier protein] reductase
MEMTTNAKSLTGEIALVTGASRGIGRAIALALGKAGAEVIVNFVSNAERAEEVVREITSQGGKASSLKFDVGNTEETQSAIDGVLKEKKKISILVNNAGITRDGLMMRYNVDDWDKVLDTNLRGAFVASQAVIRVMMKERKGAIIHISSIVGITGNAGQAAYCAAKAGLIGLTKSMAKELASRNIRVNAVAPGYIATDMTESLTAEQKEGILKEIPLGRVGTAEEIADAVLYLASPAANYVTGQTIVVDGGMGM